MKIPISKFFKIVWWPGADNQVSKAGGSLIPRGDGRYTLPVYEAKSIDDYYAIALRWAKEVPIIRKIFGETLAQVAVNPEEERLLTLADRKFKEDLIKLMMEEGD